jgi:hypothetical protein
MTPKIDKPILPPNAPTRADASILTQGLRQSARGYGTVTNNSSGLLTSKSGMTGTSTTGGT